jgi:predicted DNA-binding transcriptional regulator AlpA
LKSQTSANNTPKVEIASVSPYDRKLSVREAANFLHISKSFLDKRRMDGAGPTYVKMGRRVIYDVEDLEIWARENKRRHTAVA